MKLFKVLEIVKDTATYLRGSPLKKNSYGHQFQRKCITKYFTVIQRNRDANKLFYNWSLTTDEMRITRRKIKKTRRRKFTIFQFRLKKRTTQIR